MPDGSAFPASHMRSAPAGPSPRWGRAAGLALVLHATVALPIVLALESAPAPALIEGVELAPPMPEAAAPAEAEESPAEAQALAAPDQAQPAASAPPDAVQAEQTPPPEPMQAAASPPETTQATEAPPERTDTVAMTEVVPTSPAEPLQTLAAEMPVAEIAPEEAVTAALPPPPPPMPAPPQPLSRPRTAPVAAPARPAPPGPPVEAASAPALSTAAAPVAAPPRRPSAGYIGTLLAALERHKDYPLPARHRRAEGTALLRFAMRRDGSVASWRIERSTGDAELDAAVGQMVRRASPLPPPPSDLPGDPIELVVPVRFVLR